jgi:hypothetical protein
MLQIIRSQEQCPDKYFPAKLNRVMLSKAEKENSELSLHLCTVAYRALYVAIRWAEKNPVSGDAAELSERVALGFSFKMLGMLEQIEKENIPIDCGQVLLGPKTFFTARLIYRRLKQTKEWNKQLAALPTQMNSTIKQAATKTELDEIERKARFEMNSGNLLIKFIQTEILEAKKKKLTEGTALSLYDDIFALGVIEINRMINKKGRQK